MRTDRIARGGALLALAGVVSLAHADQIAWEGMWFNDTFGSSGGLFMLVTISGTDVSAVVDLGGNVFGGLDPDPITATGTLNAQNDIEFTGSNPPLYGGIAGTITDEGEISVDLTDAGGFFPLVEIRGTYTTTESNSTYTIYSNGTSGLVVFAEGRLEATPACLADLDGNGTLNFDDLDAFIGAFLGGAAAADLDRSGAVNFDDLDAFICSFLMGCPA